MSQFLQYGAATAELSPALSSARLFSCEDEAPAASRRGGGAQDELGGDTKNLGKRLALGVGRECDGKSGSSFTPAGLGPVGVVEGLV